MAIDRRTLLAGLGLLCISGGGAFARRPERGLYLTASTEDDGRHRYSIVDGRTGAHTDVDLPGRGHGVAVAPDGREAVAFARRPGRFAVAFASDGAVHARIDSPKGRHFYGHGAYSPDGRLLYATENDFEAGTGVIGVYDVENGYRRLTEIPAQGVGPHEVRLMADGRTLAIAVGGILTHPDAGRMKLNLGTMDPSRF